MIENEAERPELTIHRRGKNISTIILVLILSWEWVICFPIWSDGVKVCWDWVLLVVINFCVLRWIGGSKAAEIATPTSGLRLPPVTPNAADTGCVLTVFQNPRTSSSSSKSIVSLIGPVDSVNFLADNPRAYLWKSVPRDRRRPPQRTQSPAKRSRVSLGLWVPLPTGPYLGSHIENMHVTSLACMECESTLQQVIANRRDSRRYRSRRLLENTLLPTWKNIIIAAETMSSELSRGQFADWTNPLDVSGSPSKVLDSCRYTNKLVSGRGAKHLPVVGCQAESLAQDRSHAALLNIKFHTSGEPNDPYRVDCCCICCLVRLSAMLPLV